MKRVLVIYVPAVIHWVGAFTTIGLLVLFFSLPGLAILALSLLAVLCLPFPFTVEEVEDE